MMSALLVAAALAGQIGPAAGAPAVAAPTYSMADETGKVWLSSDLAWLRRWAGPEFAGRRDAPAAPAAGPAVTNYGVSVDRFPKPAGREWYGGNAPASPADRGVVGATAPRSTKYHLTVIAPSKAEAKAVVQGWERSPEYQAVRKELGEALAVQAYDAESPMVSAIGLPAGGKPDVVLQAASGKVLARYSTDPGGDFVAGELRRRNPDYDPALDPEGTGGFGDAEGWLLIGGVVLVLVLLARRKP